jgi:hypothetical protein
MVLVAEILLDDVRHHRRHAAQLGMAESVAGAGVGQELALGVAHALGDHDGAIAEGLDGVFHFLQELFLPERHLGEQDHVRRIALGARRETAGGRNPAGVAAHDFQDEDPG